jgi:O-antigen/teichoic acid export membrane protein
MLSRRVSARLKTRPVGALAAQVMVATGSFVLQVLAARELGSVGLGTFALLFGCIVMATAVTTGLIGDSLAVLDRQDPGVRAALFRLSYLLTGVLALLGFGFAALHLPMLTALLFAAALTAFVAADLSRRLLMANLMFWRLVVVDLTGFVAMAAVLGACYLAGPLELNHFLAALAIQQTVAGLTGLKQLPRAERARPGRGWGSWLAVVKYGSWRAAQQFVRPTMLNGARFVVLVAAGAAAVGELEAARVFVAPAMLMVQGLGTYLFSSYAADRGQGNASLLRRADRSAAVMLLGAAVIGGAAAGLLPLLGDVLTAGKFDLSLIGILGWACYAASCAAVLPYGSLAAVIGKQQLVFTIRLFDSVISLALVALLLLVLNVDSQWMPWLLSTGSFLGGLMCRQLVLSEPTE